LAGNRNLRSRESTASLHATIGNLDRTIHETGSHVPAIEDVTRVQEIYRRRLASSLLLSSGSQPTTVGGNSMLLLIASAISLLLGVAVMPWRAWKATNQFDAGVIVTVVAGSTFMGIGLGGVAFGVLILVIQ
jgi:hypothetical protein